MSRKANEVQRLDQTNAATLLRLAGNARFVDETRNLCTGCGINSSSVLFGSTCEKQEPLPRR